MKYPLSFNNFFLQVIYEKYVRNTPFLLNSLHELKGVQLGCWCIGTCHGKVLINLFNEYHADENVTKKRVSSMEEKPVAEKKKK